MKGHRLLPLEEIAQSDPSFRVLEQNGCGEYRGICFVEEILPQHLVALKSAAYLTIFLQSLSSFSSSELQTLGVLLEESSSETLLQNTELLKLVPMIGTVAVCKKIDLFLSRASQVIYQKNYEDLDWMASSSEDHKGAIIHPGSHIYPQVEIGEGSIIFSGAILYPFTRIGRNCRIHAGAVIGADGFGYNFDGKEHLKVWHVGGVEIGDDVEIGALSTVDAGAFRPTRLGNGTKLDNLVQIGHNSQIGKGVIFCGQSATAGSVSLGDFVVLGGKVGVGPGVSLGAGCQVAGNAMVTKDWPPKTQLGGHPARPMREWMADLARMKKQTPRGKPDAL